MLQAFVLARYADIESHDGDPDTMIIDALARSVGEVFRQQFGGYWKLYGDQPNDINHGLPVVIGYPGQQTPLQSHRLVTASI